MQTSHAFSEKVALITDGADPIGRAVAMQLALCGAFVVVGFSGESVETKSILEELRSLGTLASAIETDIRKVEGAQTLVQGVEDMFGRLDLLVNNLKYESNSDFLGTDEDVWNETVDGNLKSAFFVSREAVRLMRHRPKPAIVNIAYEPEKNAAFSAVQAALKGLTKALALEFGDRFRINCVEVRKKRLIEGQEEIDAEIFRPKGGYSEDDIARVVLYLLSSESAVVNGQVIIAG